MKIEFLDPRKARIDRLEAAVRVSAWHYECGRRVVVATGSEALAVEVDQRLWTFDPGSFVAHGRWEGRGELEDPVVVSSQPANPNRAEVLVSLVVPADVEGMFEWVVVVLPTKDEELGPYRDYYRELKGRKDLEVLYTTRLPGRI